MKIVKTKFKLTKDKTIIGNKGINLTTLLSFSSSSLSITTLLINVYVFLQTYS